MRLESIKKDIASLLALTSHFYRDLSIPCKYPSLKTRAKFTLTINISQVVDVYKYLGLAKPKGKLFCV